MAFPSLDRAVRRGPGGDWWLEPRSEDQDLNLGSMWLLAPRVNQAGLFRCIPNRSSHEGFLQGGLQPPAQALLLRSWTLGALPALTAECELHPVCGFQVAPRYSLATLSGSQDGSCRNSYKTRQSLRGSHVGGGRAQPHIPPALFDIVVQKRHPGAALDGPILQHSRALSPSTSYLEELSNSERHRAGKIPEHLGTYSTQEEHS